MDKGEVVRVRWTEDIPGRVLLSMNDGAGLTWAFITPEQADELARILLAASDAQTVEFL